MNKAVLPLLVVLCVVTAPFVFAQRAKPPAERNPADARSAKGDEQILRDAVVNFVKKYDNHKADEVAALFAPDARMVFADGTEVNGRDEIKQSFDEAFTARPKSAISVEVDSIKFLTPDVAVEEGTTNMFPDGETLTSRGRYTVLHLKKNGQWLMQSVRVVKEDAVSAYGELQSLEWLVGDWIDEGRDELVESTFAWDDNKSFLIEEFEVVREGSVALKGTQRIGWDPQAKQVRSWIFDSAGGFGEAAWTPVGDDWVCKAKGIRADGSSASATRTLIRDSQDRVIWAATDRISDDDKLPDLSVTMVRKPPQPEAP